jgi:hypothetical protein
MFALTRNEVADVIAGWVFPLFASEHRLTPLMRVILTLYICGENFLTAIVPVEFVRDSFHL